MNGHVYIEQGKTVKLSMFRQAWLSVGTFVVLCLSGGMAAAAAGNEGAGPCTKTAQAAYQACRHDVLGDYWIAIGNCHNLASPKKTRKECVDEAQDSWNEAKGECGEQSKARLLVCSNLGEDPYDPPIDPRNFVDPAQIGKSIAPNPYFPLVPGMKWVYKGGDETITVTVTGTIKKILGVSCAVVRDVASEDGKVTEDTEDWFCQDISGNVWYFGELSKEFEDGQLKSLEGSWEAGVDGAKPGIIMWAQPVKGKVYRQEFSLGNAEDMGRIVNLAGSATVPAASCASTCLVIEDSSPLSDGVEHKFYAPGIGLILESNPRSGSRTELVQFTH